MDGDHGEGGGHTGAEEGPGERQGRHDNGELVEVSCYLQLGKRGEAHAPCGSDCIKHGQPAGIVDEKGKLTILFVEEHDPRRHGEIDVREKLASLVAKQVSATGMLTTKDGPAALYVHGSDIGAAK